VIEGSSLVATQTCRGGEPAVGSRMYGFDASPTSLTLYDANSDARIFVKQ
jgi:hypothetical protein